MSVKSKIVIAAFIFSSSVSFADTVWNKTITHPMESGYLLAGDRCHFGTSNCVGSGTHLGVDIMAPGGTSVLSMCDGIVKHNNTAIASIWNSKVIIEHNCGGPFQKIYGYYGHIASDLAIDTEITSGTQIGTLKYDGINSHLHMGVNKLYQEIDWGYGSSTTNWMDFQGIVARPTNKPNLQNPANGSTVGTNVNFTWNALNGASSYRIVISQDPNPLRNFDDFSRTCNGTTNGGYACWTNSESITSNSSNISLTANKTYYWVVRSNNSDWSDIGVFSTGDASTTSTATSWTTGNYSNNQNISKTLTIPGATSLTVRVTGETEAEYDYIYIYDQYDNLIKTLTGTINHTFTVNGSSIRAQLKTDYSVTKSGVTISISASNQTSPTFNEREKADMLMSCLESKYFTTFPERQSTQEWLQTSGLIAYGRQYSNGIAQAVLNNNFYLYSGNSWSQLGSINETESTYCPNAW